MGIELSERNKKILEALIRDYIRTAEPVGSRILSRKYNLALSPATIRNVLADLEELGLVMQPHASAGRVPTERGLRYYVDVILEVRGISNAAQKTIEQKFAGLNPEAEQIIRHTSKVLSSVSRHIGVIQVPKFSRLVLKQLEFLRLKSRTMLVILVSTSGMIQNRIIEVQEDLTQEDLNRFTWYLNDILDGLTISEIKIKIVDEMRQEKNKFDRMLSQALAMSQQVFNNEGTEGDVHIHGQVNLLDSPEFADVPTMKSIFKAFEDKSILVDILDRTMSAAGVQIFIGSENEWAKLDGLTLIASRYTSGTRPLGTLGVIGPTRLNYSQIIPVVDYTARLVGHILESTL